MKKLTYLTVIMLATVVTSVQANQAAYGTLFNDSGTVVGSLAPSGSFNTSGATSLLPGYLTPAWSSSSVAIGVDSLVANVASSGSIPVGNLSQNFNSIGANSTDYNNPVGAEPQVVPEPTTLVFVGLGGLTALIFMRRLGKANA